MRLSGITTAAFTLYLLAIAGLAALIAWDVLRSLLGPLTGAL